MSHYLLYARVSPKGSTWAADETSIADQLRDGRAYVLARDPGATFTESWDEFATADHARMPAFARALAELRAGDPPWTAIVFRHIDRVGRSAVEVIQFGAELAARGRYFIAYAMPFPTEPPVGPLILGIFALLAEFERRMISQRTRSRMVSIASQGGIPYGRAPYGYRRGEKHDNRLQVHPEEGPRVLDLYRRYADGEGIASLSRSFGQSRQSCINILRRPIYRGAVSYGGHEYPGAHPALVTPELWQRVQERFPVPATDGTGRRPEGCRLPFPLTGLVRCSCGRWLTAASARGRGSVAYRYYQCTDRDHCRRRIKADTLESQVFQTLRQLPVRPAVIEEAIRLFRHRLTDEAAAQLDKDEAARLHADRRDLDRQRTSLVDLFSAGLVDRANAAEINTRLADVRNRIETIDRRLSMLHALTCPDPGALADAAAWARTFRDLGRSVERMESDPKTSSALLRAVIERIDMLEEEKPDGSRGKRPEPRWRMTLRLPGSSNAIEWLPR